MEDRMADLDRTVSNEPASPTFELYHENSKQRRNDLEFNRRIHYLTNSPHFHEVLARTFKAYPGAPVVSLPRVEPASGRGSNTLRPCDGQSAGSRASPSNSRNWPGSSTSALDSPADSNPWAGRRRNRCGPHLRGARSTHSRSIWSLRLWTGSMPGSTITPSTATR